MTLLFHLMVILLLLLQEMTPFVFGTIQLRVTQSPSRLTAVPSDLSIFQLMASFWSPVQMIRLSRPGTPLTESSFSLCLVTQTGLDLLNSHQMLDSSLLLVMIKQSEFGMLNTTMNCIPSMITLASLMMLNSTLMVLV